MHMQTYMQVLKYLSGLVILFTSLQRYRLIITAAPDESANLAFTSKGVYFINVVVMTVWTGRTSKWRILSRAKEYKNPS